MLQLGKMALLAAVAASLVSSCAIYEPRRDYSPFTAILTPNDWNIIDWRFPSSVSEGPLEPPRRLQPEMPALGVPWATGNPLAPPPDYRSAASGEVATATPSSSDQNDPVCASACSSPQQSLVAARAGARADESPASR